MYGIENGYDEDKRRMIWEEKGDDDGKEKGDNEGIRGVKERKREGK
jgi:hypothetical protein